MATSIVKGSRQRKGAKGPPLRPKANILILHHTPVKKRVTIADHLYSLGRYSGHRCFYRNLGFGGVPGYLARMPWDMIVFHTSFLSQRWVDLTEMREKAAVFRHSKAIKIALPQDEFYKTDEVCDFVNDFGVGHVYSVMPEESWPLIYHKVDRERTQIHRVLTGYLEDTTTRRIERLSKKITARPIDIGYRAWKAQPWLGRHGMVKTDLARVFQEKAPTHGLKCDISTKDGDTFLGDSWYEFLLSCRYTIGTEGGASMLDKDGTLKEKTDAYVNSHPGADFEEVEAACFPGRDGEALLNALSPRHLEACATGTCQVLTEGEYNGVLAPGKHYISLKPDFSNLDKVLESMGSEEQRKAMARRAYEDVVASGKYTYRQFVQFLVQSSGLGGPARSASRVRSEAKLAWSRADDAARCLAPTWKNAAHVKISSAIPSPLKGLLRPVKNLVFGKRSS